jgi:hypothetical protein
MKNKMKTVAALLLTALMALACASRPKAVSQWETPETKGLDSWNLSLYPEVAAGTHPFSLTGPAFGKAKLTGYAESDGSGGWVLSVDTLKWFSNWSNGWTDADFLVLGTLTLTPGETGWKLAATEIPVIESLREGSIRYKDKIVYGDNAVKMITNRWYRLEAAAEYLREKLPAAWYDYRYRKIKKGESFETAAREVLFPEVYGYPAGKTAAPRAPGNYVRGEYLSWDTLWTKENFPEHLREVRDAGTLFRDYEEMSPFLYLMYLWPTLWKEQAATLNFKEN